jgi:ELWxxDGT repeat protein
MHTGRRYALILAIAALLGSSVILFVDWGSARDVSDGPDRDARHLGTSIPRTSSVTLSGTLFFSAKDDTQGRELWRSDGTAAGTLMVKDIRPGLDGSHPRSLIGVGGTLYFIANDLRHGYELWKSNGTPAGIVMVKDIWPGSKGSHPRGLTDVGGTLYFAADDGTHGWELWKSDGTGPEPSW